MASFDRDGITSFSHDDSIAYKASDAISILKPSIPPEPDGASDAAPALTLIPPARDPKSRSQSPDRGKRHRRRKLHFVKGDEYEGELKDNLPKRGTRRFADGAVYEGEFRDSSIFIGGEYEGEWTFCRWRSLRGGVQGRQVAGQGKLTANGNRHEGEWKDGVPNGWGAQYLADGAVYEGEFRIGKRHGRGRLHLASGDMHEGEWTDGQLKGRERSVLSMAKFTRGGSQTGRLRFFNGDLLEGEWKDELP